MQYFYVIKNIGHQACLREKEHLFRYRAYFEGNLLRFVRARVHVRALITRISCAVRMRNAKLRNHLKQTTVNKSERKLPTTSRFTVHVKKSPMTILASIVSRLPMLPHVSVCANFALKFRNF